MNQVKTVAVVGGGIIGLTTALAIARYGCLVTVFDSTALGKGASWAANGALTPYSDHSGGPGLRNLACRGVELYPSHLSRLHRESGYEVDFDDSGVYEVFLEGESVEGRRQYADLLAEGSRVSWLDAADAVSQEPALAPSTSGVIYYDEPRLDTRQLIHAIIAALDASNVIVRCPETVTRLNPIGEGLVEVQYGRERSTFNAAVVCTGYGVQCVCADLPTIPITRIRGEILEVQSRPGLISRCLYRGDSFITPRRDGRLLLGTSYDQFAPGMDENPSSVTVEGALRKIQAAAEILPAVLQAELTSVWKSWRPASADGNPILGTYASESIIVALGFGGLGVTVAPAVAEAVVHAVEYGEFKDSLSDLAPGRFD